MYCISIHQEGYYVGDERQDDLENNTILFLMMRWKIN